MMLRNMSLGYWRTGIELWSLAAETQAVMAMRLMGMAGGWSIDKSENRRMVLEKTAAFRRAYVAANRAATTGKSPDQIMLAAIKPLRRKTESNARRLARRGPKMG